MGNADWLFALGPPALVALAARWLGVRAARDQARLERARPGLIRSLTPGEWAWVEGAAEPLSPELRSPVTGRPVAYYEYSVVDLGERGQILEVHEDDTSPPLLYLRDGEYRVPVRLARLPREDELDLLHQHEEPALSMLGPSRTRRLAERGIPAGDRLAAWGQLQVEKLPGGEQAAVLVGRLARVPREELLSRLRRQGERWSAWLAYLPLLFAAAWLYWVLVLRPG